MPCYFAMCLWASTQVFCIDPTALGVVHSSRCPECDNYGMHLQAASRQASQSLDNARHGPLGWDAHWVPRAMYRSVNDHCGELEDEAAAAEKKYCKARDENVDLKDEVDKLRAEVEDLRQRLGYNGGSGPPAPPPGPPGNTNPGGDPSKKRKRRKQEDPIPLAPSRVHDALPEELKSYSRPTMAWQPAPVPIPIGRPDSNPTNGIPLWRADRQPFKGNPYEEAGIDDDSDEVPDDEHDHSEFWEQVRLARVGQLGAILNGRREYVAANGGMIPVNQTVSVIPSTAGELWLIQRYLAEVRDEGMFKSMTALMRAAQDKKSARTEMQNMFLRRWRRPPSLTRPPKRWFIVGRSLIRKRPLVNAGLTS